jgi:serpin B
MGRLWVPIGRRPLLLVLAALIVCMSVSLTPSGGPQPAGPDEAELARSINGFAFDIYARLGADKGNVVFSPLSADAVLSMVCAGAGGDTAAQLRTALQTKLPEERLHTAYHQLLERLVGSGHRRAYTLDVADALWIQQGYAVKSRFVSLLQNEYLAAVQHADFRNQPKAAAAKISEWAEKTTHGRIKNLIASGELDHLTRLVAANAIYFKGEWVSRFEKSDTRQEAFTLSDRRQERVPMMHQDHVFFYYEEPGLKILQMPYVDEELSMVLLLPEAPDGLPGLEKSLSPHTFRGWIDGLQPYTVDVSVPRFEFTSSFNLTGPLQAMGVRDAFASGRADLTGMSAEPGFCLGPVIQKAFIHADEEGTEAAAATYASGIGCGMAAQPPPAVFRADHPFLYVILDRASGAILFMGRVADPVH